MKIYTKIIIDIRSGHILEEEHYDYQGEVISCKGTPEVPPPSPEAVALQQASLASLQEAQRRQDELEPFTLANLGLIRDPGIEERHGGD